MPLPTTIGAGRAGESETPLPLPLPLALRLRLRLRLRSRELSFSEMAVRDGGGRGIAGFGLLPEGGGGGGAALPLEEGGGGGTCLATEGEGGAGSFEGMAEGVEAPAKRDGEGGGGISESGERGEEEEEGEEKEGGGRGAEGEKGLALGLIGEIPNIDPAFFMGEARRLGRSTREESSKDFCSGASALSVESWRAARLDNTGVFFSCTCVGSKLIPIPDVVSFGLAALAADSSSSPLSP